MSYPVGAELRAERRRQITAKRVAEAEHDAWRLSRSITCTSPYRENHGTCAGNADPSRCLCECHDAVAGLGEDD